MFDPDVASPACSYLAPEAWANLLKGFSAAATDLWCVVCHPLEPPSLDSAAARPPPPPDFPSCMFAKRSRAASANGSLSELSITETRLLFGVAGIGVGLTVFFLNFLPRIVLLPWRMSDSAAVLASSALAFAMWKTLQLLQAEAEP